MADLFLKRQSSEELAVTLRPFYDEFLKELTPDQQAQVPFDLFLSESTLFLNGKDPVNAVNQHLKETDAPETQKKDDKADKCVVAIGTVVADAFGILFEAIGIREEQVRAATRVLLRELGEDTMRGLRSTITEFREASGLTDRAKIIKKLGGEVYNAVGKDGIKKALEKKMHWYDWLIMGATIVAQLVIWFASDGAALVAEIVLFATDVARTAEDGVAAYEACK
jgi:hypothetical protein